MVFVPNIRANLTFSTHLMCLFLLCPHSLSYLLMLMSSLSLKSIIINMDNIGKETLTSDTQLTFTCLLNKRFFLRLTLILGTGGSIYLKFLP